VHYSLKGPQNICRQVLYVNFLNNFKGFYILPINLILSYKYKFIVGKIKIIFVWVTITYLNFMFYYFVVFKIPIP